MSAQPLPARAGTSATAPALVALAGHLKLTPTEEQAMRADAWFATLDPALQHAILARATVRRLRAGTVLVRGAACSEAWYGVAAGAVRLGTALASGRQVNFHLVGPGGWFGDIPLIDGLAAPYDAETRAESTLLQLRKDDLLQLLEHHAGFGIALARLNGRRTRQMMSQFADAVALPLQNRLARQLLQLARRFGQRSGAAVPTVRLGLRLSQQDVADLLGASRQRINAGLKRFERAGLLRLDGGRWEVLQLEALERLAEG